tara:strand:- start:1942 stop:3240 length:1299 start_codon:yes stop_codon:yes gene_type:complete
LPSKWTNWARNQSSIPHNIFKPRSEAEITDIVSLGVAKRLKVRPIGNGHSFSPIGLTDGFLVSMEAMNRIISIDKEKLHVTVGAGITISDLNKELHKIGFALPNLGDIDSQSLAGAIATATHGTGIGYNSISSAIIGIRIVTGDGSVIDISESKNSGLLGPAKVSLGALGIITEVTLQCVPAFNLKILEFTAKLPEIISRFRYEELNADFVEFFWFPHTDLAEIKICNKTPCANTRANRLSTFMTDEVIRNFGFSLLNQFWLQFPGSVNRTVNSLIKESVRPERIDASHKVFCSKRRVKFLEMEYAVPRECLFEAFEKVRRVIKEHNFPVTFPVEIRTLSADNIPLSMSSERETGFIAVHLYNRSKSKDFFTKIENIMNQFNGRPHWGKLHSLESTQLAKLYPRWTEFAEAREALDPDGHFSNDYLERVLGY